MRLLPPEGARIAVTGGAGGIGRPLVAALAGAGCRVAVLDLPPVLAAHPPPGGVLALPCDLSRPGAAEAPFAAIGREWGALDGLVHLAGRQGPVAPVAEADAAAWEETAAINLGSAVAACRAAWPLLRGGANPSVVLAASGLGMRGVPRFGAYAVAKAGVIQLARTLAAEGAPWLRANAVAPTAVDTDFLRGGTGRVEGEEHINREAHLRTVPLGRLASAEEVAGPILFLLGPGASYVTGQVLPVTGGVMG